MSGFQFICALIVAGFVLTGVVLFFLGPNKTDKYIEGKYHMVYEGEDGKEKFAAWWLNWHSQPGAMCSVEWFLQHHDNLKNLRAVPTNYQLKK